MRSRSGLASALLSQSYGLLRNNLEGLTLEEALASAGGLRSVLGILKHTAGWSHVYHSYAFDAEPLHWAQTGWPRGLRDTIDPSREYLDEVLLWLDDSWERWQESLRPLPDEAFDEPHRCHWGTMAPLFDLVVMVANHWAYHAGEINEVLAICRREAWEYAEEVEENHISTAGHRIRPAWMTPEQAARYEAYMARRDAELHGGGQA
ncbi:MAG TPA: DinB family protein [Dehalococcoidia bacterium]|nr:DinB family protein [Dehalococcoidia bacterium]